MPDFLVTTHIVGMAYATPVRANTYHRGAGNLKNTQFLNTNLHTQ
jgi:hypothetical protein